MDVSSTTESESSTENEVNMPHNKFYHCLYGRWSDEKTLLSTTGSDSKRSGVMTPSWLSQKFLGWRFGVAYSAGLTGVVLIINIVLAISAAANIDNGMAGGIGTIYEGSCDVVNSWSIGLHLLINVLSSLMLAASNYTMQCLNSPTRQEIDKAHAKGERLDVGITSARNVFGGVSRKRTIAWCILLISSLPIHLLFNAVVFKTDAVNYYDVVIAARSFLDGHDFSDDYQRLRFRGKTDDYAYIRDLQHYFASDAVEELSMDDCAASFATESASNRKAVLLVTSHNDKGWSNMSYMGADRFGGSRYRSLDYSTSPFDWLCGVWHDGCTPITANYACNSTSAKANVDHLAIHRDVFLEDREAERCVAYSIESCIAAKPLEHCQLQYSLPLLAAVITCNVLKLAAMLWALLGQRQPTLVTMGDAVASFLTDPDPHTTERCLQGKSDIFRIYGRKPLPGDHILRHKRRWLHAVSKGRATFSLLLCLAGLFVASMVLFKSTSQFQHPYHLSVLSGGLGNPDSSITALEATGSTGLFRVILFVNTPQLLCSCAYFALHGLWTSMLLASEWNSYYLAAKPLRTSSPRGAQRSTYWLTIPLAYSVPLLVASILLHWLISQSLFLVRTAEFDPDDKPVVNPSQQVSSAAYSTLAMLIAIIVGLVMVLTTLGFGLCRRLKNPMPIAGSSSLAIAMACHRPDDDTDAALGEVSWGDVSDGMAADVGHCCFTSRDVRALEPDRLYAGMVGNYSE